MKVKEKELKWSDLKIGDIIKKDCFTSMVIEIDTHSDTHYHIFAGSTWISDNQLERYWKKVE